MATDGLNINDLKATYDGHMKALEAADAAMAKDDISGDDFKVAKEQFEAAQAGLNETAAQIATLNAGLDRAREIQSMRAAVAQRREDAGRLGEFLLRRPNQRSMHPGEARRRAEDRASAGDFSRQVATAVAAWAQYRPGAAHAYSTEDFEACRAVGVNPAEQLLNVNASGEFSFWARQNIAVLSGAAMDVTGPMAGPTDVLDSRDGEFAGILNRPPVQINQLAVNTYSVNGILRAPVKVLATDHMDDVEQPYLDDMMNVGRKIGEGQNTQALKNPKVGKIKWSAYKYTSDTIGWTWEQMRKSRYELPETVPEMLGIRLGRAVGYDCTFGPGSAGSPQGIVPFARLGGVVQRTAAAGKISVDEIKYLAFNSVDHALLMDPSSVGWMMSRSVYSYLATMKDGEGRPYFLLGQEMRNGRMVFTLEGFPVFINYDLPTIQFNTQAAQTGATAILFGDFSAFTVRYAGGSVIPYLLRDDVSGIGDMTTRFTAIQWVDARGKDFGNPPLAVLEMA